MRICVMCEHDIYDNDYTYCPECGVKLQEVDHNVPVLCENEKYGVGELVVLSWKDKLGRIYNEPARVLDIQPTVYRVGDDLGSEVSYTYKVVLVGDFLRGHIYVSDEDSLIEYKPIKHLPAVEC